MWCEKRPSYVVLGHLHPAPHWPLGSALASPDHTVCRAKGCKAMARKEGLLPAFGQQVVAIQ